MGFCLLCARRTAILAALSGGTLLAVAGAGLCSQGVVGLAGVCKSGIASVYTMVAGR